jgi:hypothetical protein
MRLLEQATLALEEGNRPGVRVLVQDAYTRVAEMVARTYCGRP